MKVFRIFILLLLGTVVTMAQKRSTQVVSSPSKNLLVTIAIADTISWSVRYKNETLLEDGRIALSIAGENTLGVKSKIRKVNWSAHDNHINAFNYKKAIVTDRYNHISIQLNDGLTVEFRVYDDGFAFRMQLNFPDSITIKDEVARFIFHSQDSAYVPYVNDPRHGDMFTTSFENEYQHLPIEQVKKDTLSFLPILVQRRNGLNVAITEADLENYPGMFLKALGNGFAGVFAPYPLREGRIGKNNRQAFVLERGDFIARVPGNHRGPWRVVIVSESEKQLLDNDMVYRLASPSRISDVSWIKPGNVAWDWWNNWNISGVDFRAGINTDTYKYYIDFASRYGIDYILLDEGWAKDNDLMQVIPDIDLEEIIKYAKSKNVYVWLWAGWLPLQNRMDEALEKYSKMGVVGFKVDFMDRDDQRMVQFYYDLAKKCAALKLMLDLHGSYKPTGLQRTYPNVLNFEGVRGLENVKWSNTDFPKYDCTAPFIRMLAAQWTIHPEQ